MIHRLDELDPRGLERRLADVPALLLPLGTIEWHSHHLPLGLDALKAQAIADEAGRRCGAVVAPASWWAAGGVPQPYTLRLPGALVEPLLAELLLQLAGIGFRVLAVVNGHYGLENTLAVRRAALRCLDETSATVLPYADYELLTELGARGDHAGVWETSLLWAARDDLVHLDAVPAGEELPGVIGEDPRGRSSGEQGRRGLEEAAARLAAAVGRALSEGPGDRAAYRAALAAGIDALEAVAELRETRPRDEVPPVQTPAWIGHLEAMLRGQYDHARRHAEAKRSDPSM